MLVLITPAAIPKLTVALERISRGIRLLDVAPSSAAQAL